MDREKQIERIEGAERRADAFFSRVLSAPAAQAVLKLGNPLRPKARQDGENQQQNKRTACG